MHNNSGVGGQQSACECIFIVSKLFFPHQFWPVNRNEFSPDPTSPQFIQKFDTKNRPQRGSGRAALTLSTERR